MRVAIITGASSGMGREFARQISFTKEDLDEIWIIARRKERLEELKNELHVKTRVIDGDLQKDAFYEKFQEILDANKPNIQLLVNAAGFGKVGNVDALSCIDQSDMVRLNCEAIVHMTRMSLPYMSTGSKILNLSSASAFCPQPGFGVYAATKSFVLSFSRSLRVELEKKGISVTAVCPGPVDTEFFNVSGKKEKNGMKDSLTVKPQAVVKKALIDAQKGKAVSVYGWSMKLCRVCTKIIPHGMILKIMKLFW